MAGEWSPVWTLSEHDSLYLTQGPICSHSLTVNCLAQSVFAAVRDAKLVLPLAAPPWTSLLWILSKHIQSLLLINGGFIVDYLIDFVIESSILLF